MLIRNKGPLSRHYLKYAFIMEGDTPAFLGLTDNGLASAVSPSWGGWGGRYVYRMPYGESRAIWTQGGDSFFRVTSADSVVGQDGATHVSDQATIWRWRAAFQNDFAARMDWTTKGYSQANHRPNVVVNGKAGTSPIFISALDGQPVVLNAKRTSDPDGQRVHYRWYHYQEAAFGQAAGLADISISGDATPVATVVPRAVCRKVWRARPQPCSEGVAHVILEVTDEGTPKLTSYRRVVIAIKATDARP